MKFYLLFGVNFLYSKLVFHEIRVNLSRVNFQYLSFMERFFSYNKVTEEQEELAPYSVIKTF